MFTVLAMLRIQGNKETFMVVASVCLLRMCPRVHVKQTMGSNRRLANQRAILLIYDRNIMHAVVRLELCVQGRMSRGQRRKQRIETRNGHELCPRIGIRFKPPWMEVGEPGSRAKQGTGHRIPCPLDP